MTLPAPQHLLAAGQQRPPRTQQRADVSVCVVNWNCRNRLRACLASLDEADQKVRLEVIVVDNASTDGAPEMVATEFPWVLLIRNGQNAGFARANNQAADCASGRFLFFLNNDTVVPPGALRLLLDYAEAHPEVGAIGPQLRGTDGRPQMSCRRRPTLLALFHRTTLLRWTGLCRTAYRRYRWRDGDAETTRRVEVLMGAALFVPRRVFSQCGPWDEDYTFGGEDIDLCARIGRSYPIVYYPEAAILHYGRVSSRRHIGFAFSNTVVGITRFLRKQGAPRLGLFLYKLALTADAPVLWVGHALQWCWRRLRGQRLRAARSRLMLRGMTYFLLRGLPDLWRV
jgi:GT2 family glycosyltransferase